MWTFDTTVLGGWAGTVYCDYNSTLSQTEYGDMEIHVLGRRKFQYLAIISIA